MKYEAGDEGGDVGMGSDEGVFVYYAKKFRLLGEESSSRPKSLCHFSGLTIANYKALPGGLHGERCVVHIGRGCNFLENREVKDSGPSLFPVP